MNKQQENLIEPKNKGGRPTNKELWKKNIAYGVTKLTENAVNKLGEAFAIGSTVGEACDYADIAPKTYYNWCEKNSELLLYFDRMRQKLPLKAKHNIAQAIHANNLTFSQWLVERQQPDLYAETFKMKHSGEIKGDAIYEENIRAIEIFHNILKENIKKRSLQEAKEKGDV